MILEAKRNLSDIEFKKMMMQNIIWFVRDLFLYNVTLSSTQDSTRNIIVSDKSGLLSNFLPKYYSVGFIFL
jgi:hypothetical protein